VPGGPQALLASARRHLPPPGSGGGVLLLSASGASESVNEGYRDLYQRDLALTGEYRSVAPGPSLPGKVFHLFYRVGRIVYVLLALLRTASMLP
jgi:hypothetical protein